MRLRIVVAETNWTGSNPALSCAVDDSVCQLEWRACQAPALDMFRLLVPVGDPMRSPRPGPFPHGTEPAPDEDASDDEGSLWPQSSISVSPERHAGPARNRVATIGVGAIFAQTSQVGIRTGSLHYSAACTHTLGCVDRRG